MFNHLILTILPFPPFLPSSRIRVCITPSVTAVSTAAQMSGESSWTRVTPPPRASSGCLREPTPPCWSTSTRVPTEALQRPREKTRDARRRGSAAAAAVKWGITFTLVPRLTWHWGDSCFSLGCSEWGRMGYRGGSWLNTSVRGMTGLIFDWWVWV